MSAAPFELFAAASPGFSGRVSTELERMGIDDPRPEAGGVSFSGGWVELMRANLLSHVAGRVLLRVAGFDAKDERALKRGLAAAPWRRFVGEGAPLAVRATAKRSKLFHTGMLADRVREAAEAFLPTEERPAVAEAYLRVEGDRALLSFDTSGAHLHKRGYRDFAGAAPLRENIAAALLLEAGFEPGTVLLDPLMGSGTFPVEAARMNARIAPGAGRSFAFERFASFESELWAKVKREAAPTRPAAEAAPVYGSDADAKALTLSARAARQGGVADVVRVMQSDLADLEPPEPTGLLVANPPYGRRLADRRDSYGTLGSLIRGPFRRWRWGIVVADEAAARRLGLKPRRVRRFFHGGLSLQFLMGGPTGGREGEG